jgi:hypothetical protein
MRLLDCLLPFSAGKMKVRGDAQKVDKHGDRVPHHHRSRDNQEPVVDPSNLKHAHDTCHRRVHALAGTSSEHGDQVGQSREGCSKTCDKADDLGLLKSRASRLAVSRGTGSSQPQKVITLSGRTLSVTLSKFIFTSTTPYLSRVSSMRRPRPSREAHPNTSRVIANRRPRDRTWHHRANPSTAIGRYRAAARNIGSG